MSKGPKNMTRYCGILLIAAVALYVSGCISDAKPSLLPNPDPALNKTSAQFAADAAKRHPYKPDVPRGGEAVARAQVGYWINRLEVINLSDQDWKDVEVWVNQKYVVFLPKMEKKLLKRLPFEMLFDEAGAYFPKDNNKVMMNKVELYKDGKMYDLPLQLAD
jgi:hypothetical protein